MSTDEAVEFRRWRRIVGAVLPEVPDPDRAFQELWDHFARPSAWFWFDDVTPALARLQEARIAIGVGSNFDRRLRTVLQGLGPLAPLAEAAIISSEVGYRKPHPLFYRSLCETFRLPPEQILFVGDDVANDLDGPRRAGLQAILLDREGQAVPDRPSLPDLAGLVDLLNRRTFSTA
jgi:putative hydrolase of the HAD superfamily